MAHTNFIAAIHLGTSRITGIVGRNEGGTLTVITYETEASADCIRRGCVYNVKETAGKIKRLIQKLELKIPGNRIGKVYVGTGGQSVHSLEYTVSTTLDIDSIVTDEIMDKMNEECRTYQPDKWDVLAIIPPAVYLNGRLEPDPVGISCSLIEARYKLIVARPSIRRRITECIAELAKIEIAEILVSPLALADVVLSKDEKNRGCALIDFGAGVTSLTVYKNGCLVSLCIIPLGGNLITKDIGEFLGIGEAEAEQLKRKYGNALVNKDDDSIFQINTEQIELPPVKLADFNTVVEARQQEILENVYYQLEAIGAKELRAGIVVTGKAANLENLTTVIYNRLKIDVRYAFIRKNLIVKANLPDTHPDGIALGLLLQGNINCSVNTSPQAPLIQQPTPVPTPLPTSSVKQKDADTEIIAEKSHLSSTKKKRKSIFERINDKAGKFAGDIFDEI
jgi:cell division protein FtsA